MAVQTSYPGVYIDEFAPGAPIQGVGTSTAAFIVVAARGDINEPFRLTSWDQFRARYGEQPVAGFPGWYAVRGFFENGGQVCYIVRASNGTYDRWTLQNGAGADLIAVRARLPGASGITLGVTAVNRIGANVVVFQPTGTASGITGADVTLGANEGANFRPGDELTIGGSSERPRIQRVSGDVLTLDRTLSPAPATPAPVQLANTDAAHRTVRIDPPGQLPQGALVRGSMLTIDATAQGGGTGTQVVDSVQTEFLPNGNVTYRVTFREGIGVGIDMDPGAGQATVQSHEFSLNVTQGASARTYGDLSVEPAHPRYYARILDEQADPTGLVRAEPVEPPPVAAPPETVPSAAVGVPPGGSDEDLTALNDGHFITALDSLRRVDEVNLIASPDRTALPVQQAIFAHCEQLGDRFAVLDAQAGRTLSGTNSIEAQRTGLDSTRGYAALYYPWIRVQNAARDATLLVPPSGHVCGIIARSDNTRGVHKAPANEIVNGALAVEQNMSDIEQGLLNLRGINVIRVFGQGGRAYLWGARTTATDLNWLHVSTRRLFLYLEESIQEGIRWAVFEPNNLGLWQKLRRSIREFLERAWRDGAFFGETPDEAFYVRIDETLNPFSEQALGRLHIEIGVRPAYPAEFIIVRIGIWPGGSEVSES